MSVRILVGDVRERIKDIPDNSIHCCVTSPPYMGLRDYGTAQWDGGDPACDHAQPVGSTRGGAFSTITGGIDTTAHKSQFGKTCGKCGAVRIDSQLGLEPTLAEYLAALVGVFREVKRVLRSDGTCWLNIGDSYAGGNYRGGGIDNASEKQRSNNGTTDFMARKPPPIPEGLKPKDLMLVPHRLAIALQDDGWWIRSDIIWAKRAPMPESVSDRPTSAHEHIFLLTKSPTYFYDADAVREGNSENALREHTPGSVRPPTPGDLRADAEGRSRWNPRKPGFVYGVGGRNLRNVWTLSPEPFPAAHFATFPTEIPRRAIKAGTSERGCCAACGSPWTRVIEKGQPFDPSQYAHRRTSKGDPGMMRNDAAEAPSVSNGQEWGRWKAAHPDKTTGWETGCACGAEVVPCAVLDPFFGSGTTGLVADELGRDCIGIELSREYSEMARSRIYGAAPMFAAVEVS